MWLPIWTNSSLQKEHCWITIRIRFSLLCPVVQSVSQEIVPLCNKIRAICQIRDKLDLDMIELAHILIFGCTASQVTSGCQTFYVMWVRPEEFKWILNLFTLQGMSIVQHRKIFSKLLCDAGRARVSTTKSLSMQSARQPIHCVFPRWKWMAREKDT